jgi:hypothetical protein
VAVSDDGSIVTPHADGSTAVVSNGGHTITQTGADGSTSTTAVGDDGSATVTTTAVATTTTVPATTNDDGSTVVATADGGSVAVSSDGSTVTSTDADGTVTATTTNAKDGSTTTAVTDAAGSSSELTVGEDGSVLSVSGAASSSGGSSYGSGSSEVVTTLALPDDGSIATIEVATHGHSYTVGQTLNVGKGVKGWAKPATMKVVSVDGAGGVMSVEIVDGGVYHGSGEVGAGDYELTPVESEEVYRTALLDMLLRRRLLARDELSTTPQHHASQIRSRSFATRTGATQTNVMACGALVSLVLFVVGVLVSRRRRRREAQFRVEDLL